MGTKHRNLYAAICDPANLRAAYASTARGKRNSMGFLVFKEEAEVNLAKIEASLRAQTYQPGAPREFMVYEPKARLITAMSFTDRVVQHALCRVIGPLFDVGLHGRCYACRVGKGTHRGAISVQAEIRRLLRIHPEVFFLKTDFKAYFSSILRPRLWVEIEKKITCAKTLWLIECFTPRQGNGLPIGNLTSQLWANVYGAIFDRWLIDQGQRHWHRYMDDCVVLGPNWRELAGLLRRAEAFVLDAMGLRLSRWMVANQNAGINFLGYRIRSTHKTIRKSSVTRARRKLRYFEKHGQAERRARFLASWRGHIQWANTHNLSASLGIA